MAKLERAERNNIVQNYRELGIPVVFADKICDIRNIYKAYRKKTLVISSYRLVRGILSRIGFRVANSSEELEKYYRFLAFKDALICFLRKESQFISIIA